MTHSDWSLSGGWWRFLKNFGFHFGKILKVNSRPKSLQQMGGGHVARGICGWRRELVIFNSNFEGKLLTRRPTSNCRWTHVHKCKNSNKGAEGEFCDILPLQFGANKCPQRVRIGQQVPR